MGDYIIIGADMVPTERNVRYFIDGKMDEICGEELIRILNNANYRIFNLEVPLSDHSNPIKKFGPSLIAPCAAIKGYEVLNVDLLTLANNHIYDQGETGLEETLCTLSEAAILHVGAARNIEQACKPHTFTFCNKRIGVYACTEHEFSIANNNKGGANPFDPLYSLDHIQDLKKKSDYVIVLYHGGKEEYRYPSPDLQRRCHRMIEKGADLVLCQHSHCIGCEERYAGGLIVYGQGNFIFDGENNEYWNTSVLVQIDEKFNVNYIPITKKEEKIALAGLKEKEQILKDFFDRSEKIKDNQYIGKKYAEISKKQKERYLLAISGKNRPLIYRIINKLMGHRLDQVHIRRAYGLRKRIEVENIVNCETHREMLIEILRQER